MKQLQNDFTTQEQSWRLLELGVPADSANHYYDGRGILRVRSENWMLKPDFFKEYSYFTPCWSVGRLMEIYEICTGYAWHNRSGDKIELLVVDYKNHQPLFDFSKLEE